MNGNPIMAKLNEDDIELLTDLRESPGFEFFVEKIVKGLLDNQATAILDHIRNEAPQKALYETGRRDGILDVIGALYKHSGVEVAPPHLKELRRTL